ncbi:MAG TPA: lysophospholipid acyltransferase family protein [Dehalococcoidia bacterium]|nr:lysophospholipid acyltransferase family protein [Dehalococcoidia bacterium]
MIDRLQSIFYWANVWTWVRSLLVIVTSRDVRGLGNIPPDGGLILTCNHFSVGDPPILTGIFPRRVVWMAKQELFDFPIFGKLYSMGGFIPVRRFEGDLRAIRRAQTALRRGHVLGMFPEGTRSGGRLGAGEPGTALIALRTGAPILPAAIWGTEHAKLPRDMFRRTRIHVRFGQPFRLPQAARISKESVAGGTEQIMRRIADLLPAEYRGEYGGRSAAAPTPARRVARARK